jgi:cystine transport system substrate-binding protein
MRSAKVLLLLGALQLAFSGSVLAGSEWGQVRSSGVLKVGTQGTYAPFTYHDPASGQLTGFDVEVARAVGVKLGVKVEFVEGPWDGLVAGLDDHRYDLVANEITITPQRQQKYDFSTPYVVSRGALIVKAGNNAIHSFKDLKGKKVAVALSSNFGQLALQYGAQVLNNTDLFQSIALVKDGRADATLNDRLAYLDFLKHHPDAQIKFAATDSNTELEAFILNKGQPELKAAIDRALAQIKSDGTYQRISKKYFGEDVSH